MNRVHSLSRDLSQEDDCEIKKQLITRLRTLKDKRAIKPIKSARNKTRRGGFMGLRSRRVNKCLQADADAAIKYLKALPD
jgi:hypothetical protein